MAIKIGDLDISKIYVGDLPVDKIFLGNTLIYESTSQLLAPTISLNGDTLSIEEVENAEYYDIYVDGVLEESVPAVTYNNVRIQIKNKGYEDVGYRINGGQWVLAYHYDYTDNTYNDVAKLEIACPDSGGVDDIFITSSGGTTIAHINEPGSTTSNPLDVTQYLQDGCNIEIWNDD